MSFALFWITFENFAKQRLSRGKNNQNFVFHASKIVLFFIYVWKERFSVSCSVNIPPAMLLWSLCIFICKKAKNKIITFNAYIVCHAWKVTCSQFENTKYKQFLYFSIVFPARSGIFLDSQIIRAVDCIIRSVDHSCPSFSNRSAIGEASFRWTLDLVVVQAHFSNH